MNREDGTIQQAPKTSHSKGSRKILTIGIDPASEGAATILLNGEVVCALAWRKRTRQKKRVYEITEARQGYDPFSFIVKSGGEIGASIFNLPEVQRAVEDGYEIDLVVEDTYVGRNMRTALIVARFGGLVTGTVEAGSESLRTGSEQRHGGTVCSRSAISRTGKKQKNQVYP